MMAKPRLNVSFLSYSHPHRSSHILILIACSIICLALPRHCPTCTIIHRFLISPNNFNNTTNFGSLAFQSSAPKIWNKSWFGINNSVLSWIQSYLSSRSFTVNISNIKSSPFQLLYGVPQGSILGPLLFILYTTPLNHIISRSSVNHKLYMLMTLSSSFLSLHATVENFNRCKSRLRINKYNVDAI